MPDVDGGSVRTIGVRGEEDEDGDGEDELELEAEFESVCDQSHDNT